MCGIAGLVSLGQKVDQADYLEVAQLIANQRHRGPDAENVNIVSSQAVFGACRLAITDPSNSLAAQPFWSSNRQFVICFNGQIYNHLELRTELSNRLFQTNADTESIAEGFAEWGIDIFPKLRGMFAIAVHDVARAVTCIAVDPAGQKPLYYLIDGQTLVFASEIESLVKDRRRAKHWDLDSLGEIIALRYTIGADTHIREIKKLTAGQLLLVRDGAISLVNYSRLNLEPVADRSLAEVQSKIESTVLSACDSTFALEVPYSFLLSGGIDSSAVVAAAAKNGLDLKTYSIGFNRESLAGISLGSFRKSTFEEFEFSRLVASNYSTQHKEICLDAEEYFELLKQYIRLIGEPLGSQEAPCLLRLFKEGAKSCKVMFSGSGPDEVFDGYGQGAKLLAAGVESAGFAAAYLDLASWLDCVELEKLCPNLRPQQRVIEKIDAVLSPYKPMCSDVMQLVQILNFYGRCVSHEYRQMDKLSMAFSMEVRNPLAEKMIADLAFSLNLRLMNVNGEEKWIFKQALGSLVGPAVGKRKKAGFPIPAELWFHPEYEKLAVPLLSTDSLLARLGVVDPFYLKSIWERKDPNYRNVFFRLIVLEGVMQLQQEYVK